MEKYRLNRTLWFNEDANCVEDIQIIENGKNLYPLYLKRGQVLHRKKLNDDEKKLFQSNVDFAYFDNLELKGFEETKETRGWIDAYEMSTKQKL